MPPDSSRPELDRLTLINAIVQTSIRAQVDVQAAQIAFNAVFSLGPLMALTMTLLSAIPDRALTASFRALIVPYAPEAVRPFLEAQLRAVTRAPTRLLVVLSILGVLWTISAATSSISTALGEVGWKPFDNWASRRLRAALLGIVAALGLVLSAIAATIGPVVLGALSRVTELPLEQLVSVAWVRWPVSGLFFAMASALFVTFGTSQRPRALSVIWGGTTSGLISILASLLLAIYFEHAPRLGGAYGAAGAVFAALLWLYVLALGFLIGAIVAYVLQTRGAHFRPTLRGAKHVATHAVDIDDARNTGRILRRQRASMREGTAASRISRRHARSRGRPGV